MAQRKKRRLTKKQKQNRKRVAMIAAVMFISFLLGVFTGQPDKWTASLMERIERLQEEAQSALSFPVSLPKSILEEKGSQSAVEQEAVFRFFGVEHGSASLIQAENGTNILIDTGYEDNKSKEVLLLLEKYIGIGGKIDLLVFSSTDPKHTGNGSLILDYYDVKQVWMNESGSGNQHSNELVAALRENKIEYQKPEQGDSLQLGPIHVKVLNTRQEISLGQQEIPLMLEVAVNGVSGIFSGGSAAGKIEDLKKTVQDSQSYFILTEEPKDSYTEDLKWMEFIDPEFVVISAEKNSVATSPTKEVMRHFSQSKTPVYHPASHGTMTVRVEKEGTYEVETELEATTADSAD